MKCLGLQSDPNCNGVSPELSKNSLYIPGKIETSLSRDAATCFSFSPFHSDA